MTPDDITELKENEVFVFGSNLEGLHMGGAAKLALDKFGAIYGKGVGRQGQSFAIPTMGGINQIKIYALDLLREALYSPHNTYYLTKIGCGIAGHSEEAIKPIFADMPKNVIKPKGW